MREREGEKVASASFRFLIAVCQGPRDPREKNGATATEAINNGRNYVIARRERERGLRRIKRRRKNRSEGWISKCRSSANRLQRDNTPPFLEEGQTKSWKRDESKERRNKVRLLPDQSIYIYIYGPRYRGLVTLARLRDPISLIIIIQLYVGMAYREYSLVPCYYPVLSAASPARNRGSTTRKDCPPSL